MSWIQTYTGKAFEPLAAKQEDVCLEDIAHALSNKCRYTGQCHRFYSVAEHCILGAEVFRAQGRDDLALAFLLHDAAEAYLPDVAAPIKSSVYMELGKVLLPFEAIEGYLLKCICRGLGVPGVISTLDDPKIREMDLAMLLEEKIYLFGVEPRPWGVVGKPSGTGVRLYTPGLAFDAYMRLYDDLRTPRAAQPAAPKKKKGAKK